MLSYFFPPIAGGGVQRSSKFAKYLPLYGWQPIVIGAQPNGRTAIEHGYDASLLTDIPVGTEIIRTRSIELSTLYVALHRFRARKALILAERWVPTLHTNYKIGWYPLTLRAAERLVRKRPVRMVFTSSPPYSAHLIGRRLKQKYRFPWVADFRDAWTQLASYSAPTPAHARFEQRLECGLLHAADIVIANTPGNKEAMIRAFDVLPEKIHVIPNGFDPFDFAGHANAIDPPSAFVVSCLGNFYEMPFPALFFRAYRRFADEHPEASLRFFGWHARGVRQAAETLLREGTWQRHDRIGHDSAVPVMRASSVLLANVPTEQARHWIPGKLYEYLAAGRPILLIGPADGDAAELVKRAGAGLTVGNDEGAIYDALCQLHASWRNGANRWKPAPDVVAEYDRRRQAAQLARLFSDIKASK